MLRARACSSSSRCCRRAASCSRLTASWTSSCGGRGGWRARRIGSGEATTVVAASGGEALRFPNLGPTRAATVPPAPRMAGAERHWAAPRSEGGARSKPRREGSCKPAPGHPRSECRTPERRGVGALSERRKAGALRRLRGGGVWGAGAWGAAAGSAGAAACAWVSLVVRATVVVESKRGL